MQLKAILPAVTCCACVLLAGSRARAEDADAWSGVVEPRLNYYWETSTRVVVPAFRGSVSSPSGTRIGVGYLIDAITSASVAQTGSDTDDLFTEYRHAVDAQVSQDFDFESTQLQVGLTGVYSDENDYKSTIFGGHTELTFNDKASRVALSLTRVQDSIRNNAITTYRAELSGITVGAAFEQALNPTMLLTLGYQLGYLEGYLGNPYRKLDPATAPPSSMALRGVVGLMENPPTTRTRHAASVHFAWFLPDTFTAVHALLTGYSDSWEMRAISPELRVCQPIGRDLMVRPHYRFYRQSKAWFAGPYPADWGGDRWTVDPKANAMTTHTLGVTLEYQLTFLADTLLDFGKNARLDLNIDRFWSDSRFGNGIIGSAGARLEF